MTDYLALESIEMETLISSVLLLLIITNILLLGFSQFRTCVRVVALQGIVLGMLPILLHLGELPLSAIILGIVTIAIKGLIFPGILLKATRESGVHWEVRPYVSHALSMIVGFVALTFAGLLVGHIPILAENALSASVSFFMILVGLFIIISRRKAINQILGYLVLENGMYLFGIFMLQDLPLLVDLGVLLDAFAAVFVMGAVMYQINRTFDHMDVDQLDKLRG